MEPLGQSQILNYCLGFSNKYKIIIFSLEKKDDLKDKNKLKSLQDKLSSKDIKWYTGTYSKSLRFFSYPLNLLKAFFFISKAFLLERNIKIIHLRGYALGVVALFFSKLTSSKILFDMRGFWPDEKADRLIWNRSSLTYKFYKYLEKRLLLNSEAIVSLTNHAVEELQNKEFFNKNNKAIQVIRTCTDLEKFTVESHEVVKNPIKFIHLGSVDTAYEIDGVIDFFIFYEEKSKSKIKFVNKGNHKLIKDKCTGKNLNPKKYEITSKEFSEIPKVLNESSLGIFNAKRNFSIKASLPTKIGEFLACGLPIICNNFNDDIVKLIEKNNVGLIVDFTNYDKYEEYFDSLQNLLLDKVIKKRCREVARKNFSLEDGINRYINFYDQILS